MAEAILHVETCTQGGLTRLCTISSDFDIPHALGEFGRSTLGISWRNTLFILFNRLGPTPARRILASHAI